MSEGKGILRLEGVDFAYPGGLPVLRGVSLSLGPGDMTCLVGPNGAGKSTLLALMNGLVRPGGGRVLMDGSPLASWPRRMLARRMAVVHQDRKVLFPFSVEETVAMGRWAQSGPWGRLDPKGRAAVEESLRRTDTSGLRDRSLEELSGGERQRVFLARALAQEADLLLLDEPVAHLDVRHRYELLELLADIRLREGKGILVILHDLDLAARFCDELIVLCEGSVAARGRPEDVLGTALLRGVFGVEGRLENDPRGGPSRLIIDGPSPGKTAHG